MTPLVPCRCILVPGIWGTLAVALVGNPDILGTGLRMGEQFLIQLQGVLAAAAVAFLIPLTIFLRGSTRSGGYG